MNMYWDRSDFTLGSRLYYGTNGAPLVLGSNLSEELDTLIHLIQYHKVKTLYVSSENDLTFLTYIKEHLKTDYNYNEDFTMEVKP